MIKHHRIFFHTRQLKIITIGVLVAYLIVLLGTSQYEESPSYLAYFQDQLEFEYQLQAFLPLKLLLVIMISFGWIYATRWNHYDPLLWVQSSVLNVSISRYIVLLEWSLLLGLSFTLLYLAVFSLYPYAFTIDILLSLLLSVLVFTIYYNALCFLIERLIKHIFGLLIPVLLYLFVILQTEVQLEEHHTFQPMDVLQIMVPDMVISESGYRFLFGFVMVFTMSIIWFVIGVLFVQKQDAI